MGGSVFGMLLLWGAAEAGPSDGTVPRFVRGLARGGGPLFLLAENEASLTGEVGRADPGPEVDGVPRRGTGALEAVDTTEPDLPAGLGLIGGWVSRTPSA